MNVPPMAPPHDGESFLERQNIRPVVFAIACLAIIFVLYQLVAGTITFLLVGKSVTRENVTALRLLTTAGQVLCILVPTLLLSRLLSHKARGVFPWRIPSLPETMFAILGLLFLQQLFQIYLVFQDLIPLPEFVEKVLGPFRKLTEEMFKGLVRADSIPELLVVVLVVAVVPAFVEELFFRGLIQSSFEKAMKPIQAAMITGLISGLYHFNPFAVVPLVGLGCYFGFLRFRSASIVVPMTAHFFNNGLAVLVSYFSMDDELILGASKQSEMNLQIVVLQFVVYLLLFLTVFLAYLRATYRSDANDPAM